MVLGHRTPFQIRISLNCILSTSVIYSNCLLGFCSTQIQYMQQHTYGSMSTHPSNERDNRQHADLLRKKWGRKRISELTKTP